MKASLSVLDILIFVVFILIVLGLGIFVSHKGEKDKRGYFLAGDKLHWLVIGGSITAANISSEQLLGVMGVAYDRGFVAVDIGWGAILVGFNALLWIFLPYYLRNGFYTMPEYLDRRFGGAARNTYSILVILTYILVEMGAVLYLGGLTLHSLFNVPIMLSACVLALITGVYTIIGGLKSVVWTEMLQLGVLLLGIIVLFVVTVNAGGGFSAVMESSKDWKLWYPASDPNFPWTRYIGAYLCISIFYNATNQFMVQRTLAAKNEWHAKMGVVFADYLKFLMPVLLVIPAILAVKLFPNLQRPDLLFPTLVENLLPSGLVGLVMSCLVAAIMSHLSGTINSCATILTMDFYVPYVNKKATDTQAIRFGKISGIIAIMLSLVCVAFLLKHSNAPIFYYIFNAYGYFTPGIATMFLMGIFWKGTTHAGAIAAGLLTIPLALALESFTSISFFNRAGIVFWTCMITCFLVSLVTKAKPGYQLEGLIWDRSSLRLKSEDRYLQRGLRNPVIWWGLITGIVLFFYIRFA